MSDDAWMIARELSGELTRTLGAARVQSVTVYGSLVHDTFVARQSDIDMLVLLSEPLTPGDLAELERMHRRFTEDHPAWFDRVEVQYVPAEAIRHFKAASMAIAVISPGEPFHATTAGPDWLQNWYDVRQCGVTLFGAAAKQFIPDISPEEFVEAIRVYAAGLQVRVAAANPLKRGVLAYIVISLCRARYTTATGQQIAKHDALALALAELPEHRSLLEWARGIRNGSREQQDALASLVERERAMVFVQEVAASTAATA